VGGGGGGGGLTVFLTRGRFSLNSVFGRLKASCTIFVLQHVCDTHTHTSGPV
jgi:hypothetical protein